MENTRVTQKAPNQFVVESDHELETYFPQVKYFVYDSKKYEIEGTVVAVQAVDPNYSFAYAVNVKAAS